MNEPPLPTLAGEGAALEADIKILDGKAIDADPSLLGLGGSPTRVVKVMYPSFQRNTELFSAVDEGLEAALDHIEVAIGKTS